MPQRPILVADDIENRTVVGKRRSQAIQSVASSLAQQLGANITLLYVEDIKTYPLRGFDSSRFREYVRFPSRPLQNSREMVLVCAPLATQSRKRRKQARKMARKTQLQGASLSSQTRRVPMP